MHDGLRSVNCASKAPSVVEATFDALIRVLHVAAMYEAANSPAPTLERGHQARSDGARPAGQQDESPCFTSRAVVCVAQY